MANSFLKKDQELKNRHKSQSVNSKVEEMARRANLAVEKEKNQEKNIIEEIETLKDNESKTEHQKENKNIEDKKLNTTNNKKFDLDKKENSKVVNKVGMATEEFLNLNVQLDHFEGNNTSVTISIDVYQKIKEYSEIKNLTMNFFVNKLIRVGLERINDLTIEEVQKNMCYNAKTRALPFCIDENMDSEFNVYIEYVKNKGYKFSRNTIICALINNTLARFYK